MHALTFTTPRVILIITPKMEIKMLLVLLLTMLTTKGCCTCLQYTNDHHLTMMMRA